MKKNFCNRVLLAFAKTFSEKRATRPACLLIATRQRFLFRPMFIRFGTLSDASYRQFINSRLVKLCCGRNKSTANRKTNSELQTVNKITARHDRVDAWRAMARHDGERKQGACCAGRVQAEGYTQGLGRRDTPPVLRATERHGYKPQQRSGGVVKIKNSTDWPAWFLRRMTGWCCKQLEMPSRDIKQAVFRNSRAAWGGCARYLRGTITVCVGHSGHFPTKGYKHANGHQNEIADRVECLVWVTAHEAAHVAQKQTRTRQSGGGGGSEIATEWCAAPVLARFRELRASLILEWNTPPAVALRAPTQTLPERRAAKAQADLVKWVRRLRIAQTKVSKLKTRVRYYERKRVVIENRKAA